MTPTEQATKPEADEQTKPQAEPAAKPEKGREQTAQQPSKSVEEPSQTITKEQYDAAVKAMNEAQRQRAEYERQMAELSTQANQYREMAQVAAGVVKQQTDPVAAAEAELNRILEEDSYNTPAIVAAQRRLYAAEKQRDQQSLIQQITQMQRIQSDLPKAGEMLGIQDHNALSQQLTSVHQSLTPAELAVVALHRKGKLADFVSAEQRAREEKARQAEALKSLGGSGGGRVVPGSLSAGPAKKKVDWISYRTASKAVRDAIDADPDIEVVNVPED